MKDRPHHVMGRTASWRIAVLAVAMFAAVGLGPSVSVGAQAPPSDDPVVLDRTDLDLSPLGGTASAFSPSAEVFLAVWVGGRGGGPNEVFGRLLSGDGSRIGDDFRISFMGPAGDHDYGPFDPSVVYSPRRHEFVVAWASDDHTDGVVDGETEIYAQRVGTDGSLRRERQRISVMGPPGDTAFEVTRPRLAYNPAGDEIFVVWQANDDSPGGDARDFEVFGQRVTSDLVLTGDRVQISQMVFNSGSLYLNPAVTHDPVRDQYLVAWFGAGTDEGGPEIWAKRVSADGNLIGDRTQISFMSPPDDWRYGGFNPAIAFSPSVDGFLVVWHGNDPLDGGADEGEGSVGYEIYGRRVDGDGSPVGQQMRMTWMDPPRVENPDTLTSEAFSPTLTYVPATGGFVLSWNGEDLQCFTIDPIPDCQADSAEVYARLLDRHGTPTGSQLLVTKVGAVAQMITTSITPGDGYLMLESNGTTHGFGDATALANPTPTLDDAVDIAITPTNLGHWTLHSSGQVTEHGDAPHIADITTTLDPTERPTTLIATPAGAGYRIFTDRGRTLTYGDAINYGGITHLDLDGPVIDSAATPSGHGYYMLGTDGGVFTFGDATFYGSIPQILPGVTLDGPIVGIVPTPTGAGYWLVASDGGVFSFGDAAFHGSIPQILPGVTLVQPVNGMVAFGNGYLMVASDGGVFNFSDLTFHGSLGNTTTNTPIIAIAPTR